MADELKFQIALARDVADIVRLVNFVYRGESGARSWTGEAHLLDGQRTDNAAIENMISQPQSKIILAKKSGNLVGCVHVKKDEHGCYLGMLTAHVDQQKSGIGSALVKEAERVAKNEFGCERMRMTVISLRTELIDWYLRRGYRITEQREPFPYGNVRFGIPKRDDLEFVVLVKDLK